MKSPSDDHTDNKECQAAVSRGSVCHEFHCVVVVMLVFTLKPVSFMIPLPPIIT